MVRMLEKILGVFIIQYLATIPMIYMSILFSTCENGYFSDDMI